MKTTMWNRLTGLIRKPCVTWRGTSIASMAIMLSAYLLIASLLLFSFSEKNLANRVAIVALYLIAGGVLSLLVLHALEGREERKEKDEAEG